MRSETAPFIDMLKFARRVAVKVGKCDSARFELELEPVWQTAREDIPVLIGLLEPEFGPILDSTERPSP
jgi:hypothetical protein